MPPSALGLASGLLRISALVNPAVTSPAVARAVHQLVSCDPGFRRPEGLRLPPSARALLPPSARVLPPSVRVPWQPETFRSPAGLASRSSFSDAGGTRVAPGWS